MKTYRTNFTAIAGVLLMLLITLSGCNDDEDNAALTPAPDVVTLKEVTLSGAQEVPANSSIATGVFKGTYNKDTHKLSYTITFDGITPTAMHFHSGAVGVSGPAVVPITAASDPYYGSGSSSSFKSPLSGTTPVLTTAQEADLLAGNWYLNIHSSQYPDGEIRAQIIK